MTYENAHAARIEDGIVREVIVIPHLDDDDQKITEYCNRIGLPGTWVDTSYTGSRRGKYAGTGDEFHSEARSGEGEFVSPVVEEPEPEPEPEGAFVYTSDGATTPPEGKCKFNSYHIAAHKDDQSGLEISGSFQQIINVQIPSIDHDEDYLICKWTDSSATKKLIYGPGLDGYSSLNDGLDVRLAIRDNVEWTDQVIPVYHQSSGSTSGDGYTCWINEEFRYNGRDVEGNPWPVVTPGMKFQGVASNGYEYPVVQVVEVTEYQSKYVKLTLDKSPSLPVFQNGLTLRRVE